MDATKVRQGLHVNLATNLKRLAGMHLVRQDELAEAVGLSRQGIHHLFAGKSAPRTNTAMAIAQFFGITVEDLYSEPGECLRAASAVYESAPAQTLHQ